MFWSYQGFVKSIGAVFEALKGIDLRVPRGCVYGLLGPNGAGKSTMVKILTTLIRRSGGNGTMLGKPIGDRKTLQQVGLLPEHTQFSALSYRAAGYRICGGPSECALGLD